jgi:ubiquinone/menaquinone biosynthesis C-methylase UbiE
MTRNGTDHEGGSGGGRGRTGAQGAGHQQPVNERFHDRARRWEEVYQREDLFSVIHRHRQARALSWIDALGLPAGSPVLEIGPGAGFMTVELARRGFTVQAADSTPRMIEIASRRVAEAGVDRRVRLLVADAHHLAFADGAFTLVVALGVVPWLRHAPRAVAEMARVLRPGGHLVLNADNSRRLTVLLDPRHNPVLTSARLATKTVLRSAGVMRPTARQARVTARHLADFDATLSGAGLEILRGSTFGFGPFTLFGWPVTSERLGVRLNARLQRLADNGVPGIRAGGGQYLVLARAPVRATAAADAADPADAAEPADPAG